MKPEVWNSCGKISCCRIDGSSSVGCCLPCLVKNKMHAKILTCAIEGFQKSRKIRFFFHFLQMRKKSAVYQIPNV